MKNDYFLLPFFKLYGTKNVIRRWGVVFSLSFRCYFNLIQEIPKQVQDDKVIF